jgi:hypothetical protein
VFYGDQPVANAMVIVATTAGPSAGGAQAFADDEGNYKVDNVPVGNVLIAVNTDAPKGMMMAKAMSGTNPYDKNSKRATVPKVTEVPKKYHVPATSKLTFDVQRGVNKHDIRIPK